MEQGNVYSNLMQTNIKNREELSSLLWDAIDICSEKKLKYRDFFPDS